MRTKVCSEGEVSLKDINRGLNLVEASNENGAHAQWLTGVRVAMDLTCTNKMWVEAERYRFLEFVSSQSTMHRIAKFDISSQCNSYVDKRILDVVEILRREYKENSTTQNYLKLLYNIPSGFELTARITTNYRCLLNIYIQRNSHRLPEWREFCDYIYNNLPLFKEIVAAYQHEFDMDKFKLESETEQQLEMNL
jgi:hypothetical protein